METKEGQKTQGALPTEKQHLMLCYGVIDFGTQTSQYGDARKIWLQFEIPGEKAVFNKDKGEQCFSVGCEYTFSLDKKANFRKALDSWLGATVTEMDSDKLAKLLKRPCMGQIIHERSEKDGLMYAKLANKGTSIFKRPADQPFPKETENKSFFLDLDNFSQEAFDMIPMEWMKEKVKKSPEYKLAVMGKAQAPAQTSQGIEAEDDF
jgi:hypothetical protein